jgi:hypothetical protein
MTDETDKVPAPETDLAGAAARPKPDAAAAPLRPATLTQERREERLLPLLTLAGFVILAGAIAYLWTRPVPTPNLPPIPADQSGVISALKNEVASLQSALYALDTRERADVAALHEAIANIPINGAGNSAAPTATSPSLAAPAGAASSDAAIAALKSDVDQVKAAQETATQSLPSAAAVSTLSGRVDAVAQKQSTDADALRQQISDLRSQIDQLTSEAQSLAQSTKALPQLSAQSDHLTRLLRVQAALSAGAPLGDIPNAPAALSRFASSAPPTDAALVLAYTPAAHLAEAAGGPPDQRGGFWRRVWQRIQNLVTVRQGDRVLVGDPTSGVLAHAQRLLVAGDLPGALDVLKTLQGPAATAMAPWIAQAQSLVDARQALAQMAAG